MKLRQREYCHNCDQYVVYEFEDVTDRQVIICPNCGHQHYRELDEGTILNIRMENMRPGDTVKICKAPELTSFVEFSDEDIVPDKIPEMEIEEREVIGTDAEGRAIVEAKDGEEKRKYMTERRWGRDPRQ